jgi:hypothetical protein
LGSPCASGHPAQSKPQASHRLRLPYVPLAPSDRKLLL